MSDDLDGRIAYLRQQNQLEGAAQKQRAADLIEALIAQFVVNFCRRLAKRFGAKKKLNGKPLKAKIEFGKKNLVSVFVDFVEAPDRLSAFFGEMAGVLDEA